MDNPINQEEISNWRAPDMGKFKVNCDVAIPKDKREGKIAVVLRNYKGKVMDGFVQSVKATSSLCRELIAIRAACQMILTLCLNRAVVESDNKSAILLSVSKLVPPWESSAVVRDINSLICGDGKHFL